MFPFSYKTPIYYKGKRKKGEKEMKLSNADRLSASIAICKGDTFRRGDVLLFSLFPGEYCVQKATGPVTYENRIITTSWGKALSCFEQFLGD